MKKIFQTLKLAVMAAIALPLAVTLGACSDDEDTPAALAFPETQILNCTTGETKTLEFDAAADWKLSSSQSWCKFVQNNATVLSAAGKAGHQSITLSISDEGLTQGNASVAQLTLYMQGQSGVLAEITRSAAGYELKVFDAEGHEIQEITVGYNTYAAFQVEANFAFAATSLPDWAELQGGSLTGAANRMTEAAIRVVPNGVVEKTEQEGTILFQDMKGLASFCVKVVYAGMDRDAILINQPGGNAWNWKVNADGTQWTHESNTYNRFIECGISAYHDDYEILCVEDNDDQFAIGAEWLHYKKEMGRLIADPTEETRSAYVLAFPRQVYDEISSNLEQALFETDENGRQQIAYKWQQNNLVAHVTQEVATSGGDDDSEVGFVALCFDESWNQVWIRCNLVKDNAMLDRCEEMTGCRELYLLDTPSPRGHFDQIRPWPQISEYENLSGESAYFMDKDGNRMEDETPELSFSDSETPSYWYIMGVHNTTEPMYLVLLDAEAKNVTKVLLIDTKSE